MELRNIKKFGIELEGGWDTAPRDARLFKRDSSVHVPGAWKVGEIVSPILTDWQSGSDFLLVNYPDHTGASCGLHVHLSFGGDGPDADALNRWNISRLADSESYQTGLLESLKALAAELKVTSKAFFSRVNGENTYCRTTWTPENVQTGNRYRVVNFAAYERHRTVEIRVLPMFSKRQISARMVKRVLSFTDRYLTAQSAEPFEVRRTFPLSAIEPSTDTIVREVS